MKRRREAGKKRGPEDLSFFSLLTL
jgi:hypothetical protein